MRMSLEDLLNKLLKEGKVKKQKTDIAYLNALLESSKRNLEAASLVKGKVNEAAFKLAYDGLLQLGRLILMLDGYRPSDGEQHKTTFLVAGHLLGKEYNYLIEKIQKFRIKRNICIYEPRGLISQKEVDAIYKTAQEFWKRVRIYLRQKHPQLKLFKEF
jgi:hypothetical protein